MDGEGESAKWRDRALRLNLDFIMNARIFLAISLALIGYGRAASASPVTLTFEVEDEFATPLVNGQAIATPPRFGRLVVITSSGENRGPAVFDSAPNGPNANSSDRDLLVNTGNVVILQNINAGQQTVEGIFDRPCDSSRSGGRIVFDFAAAGSSRRVYSIDVVDRDGSGVNKIRLYDAAGRDRTIYIPSHFTGDVDNGAVGIATIHVYEGLPDESPQQPGLYTKVDTDSHFDPERIVRMKIYFNGSGGVDNLSFEAGCATDDQCADDDPCTLDTCHEGECIHETISCADDLYCNGEETCVGGQCVGGDSPCPPLWFCDEERDECVECVFDVPEGKVVICHYPPGNPENRRTLRVSVHSLPAHLEHGDQIGPCPGDCPECHSPEDCQDTLFCNGKERCVKGECVPGEFPCPPGQGCNEEEDRCIECLDNETCDDGMYCTGKEYCQDGVCLPGELPCPSGHSCDEENDRCGDCTDDDTCRDQFFCNGPEECRDGFCVPGPPPCDDEFYCDEENDRCKECRGTSDCNDGLYCTGQETCHDGMCVDGDPPCRLGLSCDEEQDRCYECVTDYECADGLFCNGAEKCDEGFCMPGDPPCRDQLHCDEDTDRCIECVADDVCDDDLYCNGYESCEAGECVPGEPPCGELPCDEMKDRCAECNSDEDCGDGLFCKRCDQNTCVPGSPPCEAPLTCDEENERCKECQVNEDCDDGSFCTGVETCADGRCLPGDAPCDSPGRARRDSVFREVRRVYRAGRATKILIVAANVATMPTATTNFTAMARKPATDSLVYRACRRATTALPALKKRAGARNAKLMKIAAMRCTAMVKNPAWIIAVSRAHHLAMCRDTVSRRRIDVANARRTVNAMTACSAPASNRVAISVA
jgi:hypothetical protein